MLPWDRPDISREHCGSLGKMPNVLGNNVSHPCFRHPGKIGMLNLAWSFNWKGLQDAPGIVRFKGNARLFRRPNKLYQNS